MRFVLLLVLILMSAPLLIAQDSDDRPVSGYIPTENISKQKSGKNKNRPKRKSIDIIIKNKPEKILYGNPCMIEETHKMGFEYAIQTPGLPGSVGGFKLWWHNMGVYTKLIVTKSPFWKMTLNKRVKDCRERTGDLVG